MLSLAMGKYDEDTLAPSNFVTYYDFTFSPYDASTSPPGVAEVATVPAIGLLILICTCWCCWPCVIYCIGKAMERSRIRAAMVL